MKKIKPFIGVIGSGEEDPETNRLAEEVGSLIASEGHPLVNGGLAGVMAASARGCAYRGGLTVGILPGLDPAEANPHIEVPIPTGLGEMRNLLIIRTAPVFIAVGGGYGTLSEIALALKLKKTVVGLNTWEVSKDVIKAAGPADAVKKAISALVR